MLSLIQYKNLNIISGGESGSMYPPPSPAGSGRAAHKSRGGDMWGAAAESWSSGSRRTPGQGRAGGEHQLGARVLVLSS